ncbi:kinesin-domain-containing protein [Plenodomus tracheiphilus IPT5]|uniref:Kinesin-like protein n=1 Tax=Plenodomus tracheiphilus IPT5 TaxID=1408161 RepID=A0A6A7AS51_9PLEO|nr:kinesin-domain-containing protein [Plenodomus tracheiphilus IPT5]
MDYSNENVGIMKRSGIPPPKPISLIASPPPALAELRDSSMNARSAMAPPTMKHKPSGLPEPASKIRKTLKEKAGEPIAPKPAASSTSRLPPSSNRSTAGRNHAASTSRVPSKGLSKHPSVATLGGSVGGPRAPARPKSAYGQYNGHARSKSYHQGARPATAMRRDQDEDDDEEAERKDFYNERIEAMERDFRMFKEKMEGDVGQATNYKESLQQLQNRVTELEAIRARLEVVNKGLESELDDTRSCLKSVKMEMEMTQQKHSYEVDDLRRRLRNEVEELEFRHQKDTARLQRQNEEAESKVRKELEERIDKLLKDHSVELAELRKKLDVDTEAERARQSQLAQEIETEYASKLRVAALDSDTKQREIQLLHGEVTNVKAELDRERLLKTGLQTQLTESMTNNLALDAANKAMKEKIHFLESDSQAQSQAFNDLHKRMQDAIEAAERAHDKLRQEETLRRKLFNQVQELKGNIRVMCRVRPAHESETEPALISYPDNDTDSKEVAITGPSKQSATGKDITASYAYSFDRVFGPMTQNAEVFEEISQLVQSALDGYNVCIFCYGQTGSGKTHTMSSADGVIPRATAQIWEEAQRLQEKGWRYSMEGSFIEVYNETYNDLLGRSEDLDKKKVEVRHDAKKMQTYLENAVSVMLDGPDSVEKILDTASKNRTVAATKANMRSSRSHSVFILKLVGTNEVTGEKSEGTLNLVDLAGSERLEHSKAEGTRLKETQNINKSLSCLGDVINAIGSAKESTHIPYRNSKLTFLLQNSLGGNSKTLMFVMVSPLQAHLQETLTSLKFATKVHNTHIGTAKKQTKNHEAKQERRTS